MYKTQAIIYLRVSTDRQVQLGASLENQEKACLEWCYRNEILPLQIFKDAGKSAKTLDRPEMQRMLEFINKNYREIDYLIVYQIDRLSRRALDYFEITQTLGKNNIQIRDASESLDSTPANDLVRGINALMGEFDNRLKSQRVLDNMKQAANKGYRMHKAPYGLKNVRDMDGKSVVETVPEIAHKIATVLNDFSLGLYTKKAIANKCTDLLLTQPNGKPMSIQLVDKLLKNPLYAGLERSTLTDNEYVDSIFEGIVTKQTFLKNQELLSGDGSRLRGTYKILNPDYPLRGFVKCIHCNRKLTGSASTGNGGKRYPRYTCNTKGCKKGYITPTELHDQFKDLLAALKPTSRKALLLKTLIIRKWTAQSRTLITEKMTLQNKLHELEEKQLKAIEKHADGEIDKEDFQLLKGKYSQLAVEIENQLADIHKRLTLKKADIDYAISYLGNAPQLWQDASPDMRVVYQQMVFPEGIIYDLQKKQFGTLKLSVLYSLANIKKDPSLSEKSLLVIQMSSNWNSIISEITAWIELLRGRPVLAFIPAGYGSGSR